MREIPVVLYREDDQWVAQALSVDVSSCGPTPEAARDAIQEALELYFEDDGGSVEIRPVAEPRLHRIVV